MARETTPPRPNYSLLPSVQRVDSPGQSSDEGLSHCNPGSSMRMDILNQLHAEHQGITECHERARQISVVAWYWPAIRGSCP